MENYSETFFKFIMHETHEDGGFAGGLLAEENDFDFATDVVHGRD